MDAAGLAGNGVDSTGRDGSDPADGAQSDTPGRGGRADPVGSGAGQMGAEELGGAALDSGEPGELAPADSGHCGMSVSAAVLETARSDGPHTDAPGPEGPANPAAAGGGQAGAAGAGGLAGGVPDDCGREAWPAWEGLAGTGPAGGLLVSRSDSADGHCQAGGRLGCRWLAEDPWPGDDSGLAGGTDPPGGTGPAGGADLGGVLTGLRGGGTQVTVAGWSAAEGCAPGRPASGHDTEAPSGTRDPAACRPGRG